MIRYTQEALIDAQAELGWDFRNDDFEVCIGGTSVYEIDGHNTKWSPTKGTKTHLSSSNESLPSPLPNLIALLLLIILTLATIALGYIKGNMHLLTTLKNAKL